MKLNGEPIDQYHYQSSPATITYTMAYEEEQARIYAGMSILEYDALPGTPQWIDPEVGGRSKSDLVIIYRMSKNIPAAVADIQAREMQRNARRRH